jgi:hypothetical protein
MVYLLPKHSLGYQQHLYRAIIIYICITDNHSDIYTQQLLCTHSGLQYSRRDIYRRRENYRRDTFRRNFRALKKNFLDLFL